MGNWQNILGEINIPAHDRIRRKYLSLLHEKSGRNVLCYYSGWLQKTSPEFNNIVSITDEDKAGFMSCFSQMDFESGLDLIIHSPGGQVSATESLINYIRSKFGSDIRVFVPQIAMSGGTLMALCGKEIFMGNHSNLGPIDPQFGHIPAVSLIEEFERARDEIKKDPSQIQIWAPILSQIHPTFLTQAQHAINLSAEIAIKTLTSGMLESNPDKEALAKKIAEELNSVKTHKEHNRHIHKQHCRDIGLTITDLEADPDLQDIILSIHHAFMVTLSNTRAAKIIENHLDSAYIKSIA